MVVVGGITRLTESGLSITEWRPVTGILPPLNDAAWAAEFAKYQRIPEYQLLNQGMTLAQFKGIFFWEYVHRLLGRQGEIGGGDDDVGMRAHSWSGRVDRSPRLAGGRGMKLHFPQPLPRVKRSAACSKACYKS